MKKVFISFFLFLCCIISKAAGEMPIIAYWGIPDSMSYEQCFRNFRDCGFTVSIYPYHSLEKLVEACHIADKQGVKIIGCCQEQFDAPIKTANILKKTKGFLGYMIQDEPSVPDMHQRQKVIKTIQTIDNGHLFYVNLLPYYKQEWFAPVAKVNTYQEYLDAAATMPVQQISFDFYPVTTEGIRDTWYDNLEQIRKLSNKTAKPFWGFVLSVPHIVYPQPTLASLRLQVYSNLAYGAQAIQYFTYWTPSPTKEYDFHDAPISRDGKKTKTYDVVQQMNRELKVVAPLFYGAKVLSVHHLGAIPEGTTRQTAMPLNIRSLKIVGRQGAIVSQFQQNGHRYLAVVNKSHEQPLTLRIRPRNNTPRHITKQLQEEAMKTSYTISAGDIALFRLR